MTAEEQEQMIKALLKRINEKDQFMEDLKNENLRLAQENGRLRDLAKRLVLGWDEERVNEFGGEHAFGRGYWPHWEMIKDPEVTELF